jgi:signal transduction protein with GAF and PtsI domain
MTALQTTESILVSFGALITIVITLRLWSILKLFFDRTKLVNALDASLGRAKDKDQQIEDLKDAAAVAKTGQDAWRDEVARLNGKIEHLEESIRELSEKLDVTVRKYEIAVAYIAIPDEKIPLAIADDVHRARLLRQ